MLMLLVPSLSMRNKNAEAIAQDGVAPKRKQGVSTMTEDMDIDHPSKRLCREDGLNLDYNLFDWDDNVVRMPTKIWVRDDNGAPFTLSTEEFAKRRNDPDVHIDYS